MPFLREVNALKNLVTRRPATDSDGGKEETKVDEKIAFDSSG